MSETEGKGEFLELQKDESKTMSANQDQEFVKENTEGYSQEQPPASNPGSSDPSGGIPSGSGGVSSAADVGSPEESSKPGIVESTVESVRNYLGNLSILGGPTLAAEETKTAGEGSSTSTGTASGITAGEDGSASTLTATATTPAAAVEEQKNSSSEGTSDANNPDSFATSNTASTTGEEGTKADSESKAGTISQDDTRAQDETQTEAHDSSRGVSAKDDTTPAIDDSEEKKEETAKKEGETSGGGEGYEGEKPAQSSKTRENESAIPTAGGERLGEKHWGESKIVPDVPKKEGENVSSKDGQPDQQTKDNTSKNIGGSGDEPADSGEGKQKLTDKIKDKLPFGKKD